MRRILIVDDEDDIREELADYLSRKGFQVSSARDGLEAMELFEKDAVEAVITDVKMPRCDGHQLIRKIRASDPATPIIAVTGHYSPDELEKIARVGASTTLRKPIKLWELMACLQDLLPQGEPRTT